MESEKLSFYESAVIYFIAMPILWISQIVIIPMLILSNPPYDWGYWGSWIFFAGCVPFTSFCVATRCLSRIEMDEKGIKKHFLKRFKRQEFTWEEVRDCKFLMIGSCYIMVSDQNIWHRSMWTCEKDKNCIFFTYNKKALEFIKKKCPHLNIEETIE